MKGYLNGNSGFSISIQPCVAQNVFNNDLDGMETETLLRAEPFTGPLVMKSNLSISKSSASVLLTHPYRL